MKTVVVRNIERADAAVVKRLGALGVPGGLKTIESFQARATPPVAD